MNIKKNKSGFTLLEIIIVIIIVGVLASLALPRFFSTVEFSRSQEALSTIAAIRGALERCYLSKGGNYTACALGNLDIDNPASSPNAHFAYVISGQTVALYVITATRNTLDGGVATDTVILSQNASTVTRAGTTAFHGLN